MLDSFLNIVGHSLQRRSNPEGIRHYLEGKQMEQSGNLDFVDPRAIGVAVVQEQIRVMRTYQAYADRMYRFVADAAGQGAQLVCFPEENGVLLLGQLPMIQPILKLASRQLSGSEGEIDPIPPDSPGTPPPPKMPPSEITPEPAAQAGGISVAHILSFFTPFIKDAFEATFSTLSKGFGLYIMAGSVMLVEDEHLYNRAYLFGPQGEIVGTQDKAHPVDLEIGMGLTLATELKVFDTRLGRLAFPVCMDATYFETFKILKRLGAQIIIVPISNLEPFQHYLALRGIWPRVQESGVYGLKSALVGNLYALQFTGQAGVYAPFELTDDRTGVVAQADSFDQDDLITASLDLTRLETYHSAYFGDSNPSLYRRYIPEIYGP